LTAVAFGNNEFVAVGTPAFTATDTSAVILTSPDGVTWTRRVSGAYVTIFNGVGYGNNEFVVVGSVGKILTSETTKSNGSARSALRHVPLVLRRGWCQCPVHPGLGK